MGQNIRVKVLNDTDLVAADFAVTSGVLNVEGIDPYNANGIQSLQVYRNLPAVPMTQTATATSVASTSFELDVQAEINGNLSIRRFQYTTNAGNTTTSAAAMVAAFNAWAAVQGFDFYTSGTLSASNSGADVTFTGVGTAANIFVKFIGVLNVTASANMGTLTLAASDAQVVGESMKITFSAPHGLKTGQVIKFGTVGAGGANAALIANQAFRVTYSAPTKVTLEDVLATATTVVNTGTVTLVAQDDFGSVAFVNADAEANGFADEVATATTYQYALIEITGKYPVNAIPESPERVVTTRVWCPENLIASTYTAVNATFLTAAEALEG